MDDHESVIQFQMLRQKAKPMESFQFNFAQVAAPGRFETDKPTQKFSQKVDSLMLSLDKCHSENRSKLEKSNQMINQEDESSNAMMDSTGRGENNGNKFFYTLDDEYDDQAALAQAYEKVQVQIMEDKMENLKIGQPNLTFKSKKESKPKILAQKNAEIKSITKKMATLSISA